LAPAIRARVRYTPGGQTHGPREGCSETVGAQAGDPGRGGDRPVVVQLLGEETAGAFDARINLGRDPGSETTGDLDEDAVEDAAAGRDRAAIGSFVERRQGCEVIAEAGWRRHRPRRGREALGEQRPFPFGMAAYPIGFASMPPAGPTSATSASDPCRTPNRAVSPGTRSSGLRGRRGREASRP